MSLLHELNCSPALKALFVVLCSIRVVFRSIHLEMGNLAASMQ